MSAEAKLAAAGRRLLDPAALPLERLESLEDSKVPVRVFVAARHDADGGIVRRGGVLAPPL